MGPSFRRTPHPSTACSWAHFSSILNMSLVFDDTINDFALLSLYLPNIQTWLYRTLVNLHPFNLDATESELLIILIALVLVAFQEVCLIMSLVDSQKFPSFRHAPNNIIAKLPDVNKNKEYGWLVGPFNSPYVVASHSYCTLLMNRSTRINVVAMIIREPITP